VNDEIFIDAGLLNNVRITLIGVGGAGCNTVNRLSHVNIGNVNLIAANTDAQHLEIVKAPQRIIHLVRGFQEGN
jgi:cell division protein FtsZ